MNFRPAVDDMLFTVEPDGVTAISPLVQSAASSLRFGDLSSCLSSVAGGLDDLQIHHRNPGVAVGASLVLVS